MVAIETTIRVTTDHKLTLRNASLTATIKRVNGSPELSIDVTESAARMYRGWATFSLAPDEARALAGLLLALAKDAEGAQ